MGGGAQQGGRGRAQGRTCIKYLEVGGEEGKSENEQCDIDEKGVGKKDKTWWFQMAIHAEAMVVEVVGGEG